MRPSAVSEQPVPLTGIDWSRPWFAAVAAHGRALAAAPDLRAALSRAAAQRRLTTAAGLPVSFVPQTAVPAGMAYEAHIGLTGQVPTRSNLHDFFNALVWLAFPRGKAALNARQSAEIARQGVHPVRGGVRDAATLFDENAALFVTADPGMAGALRQFRWTELFVSRRARWGQGTEVLCFGHALMEKLTAPYKAVTAHAWVLEVDGEYFATPLAERVAGLDGMLAAQLAAAPLHSRLFAPLPVLGIPGWWAVNEDPAFYADTGVFRPGRRVAGRPAGQGSC